MISDEDSRDKMRVNLVEDKMLEVRLRWFEHEMRRCMEASVQSWLWMVHKRLR